MNKDELKLLIKDELNLEKADKAIKFMIDVADIDSDKNLDIEEYYDLVMKDQETIKIYFGSYDGEDKIYESFIKLELPNTLITIKNLDKDFPVVEVRIPIGGIDGFVQFA